MKNINLLSKSQNQRNNHSKRFKSLLSQSQLSLQLLKSKKRNMFHKQKQKHQLQNQLLKRPNQLQLKHQQLTPHISKQKQRRNQLKMQRKQKVDWKISKSWIQIRQSLKIKIQILLKMKDQGNLLFRAHKKLVEQLNIP